MLRPKLTRGPLLLAALCTLTGSALLLLAAKEDTAKPGASADATKPAGEARDAKGAKESGSGKSADDGKESEEDKSLKKESTDPKHKIPAPGSYPYTLPTGTFFREPYVQLATKNSMHVVWRTLKPLQPVVKYGTEAATLTHTVEPAHVILRKLEEDGFKSKDIKPLYSAPKNSHQYEVEITGLKAGEKYFYGVWDGETRLTPEDESYSFRTLPEPFKEKECNFWVVGDSGTGAADQKAVNSAMRDYVAKENITLDIFAHVGDMAYSNGKDSEFQRGFFDIYSATLRNTVCFAAMGNHEGHSSSGMEGIGPFYDAYVLPARGEAGGEVSGSEGFYSYDFGRVHFIVLNSYDMDRKPGGVMSKWLKNDLDKVKESQTDWIVSYFHHPPYTKGSHDSDNIKEPWMMEMRKHIMPILEAGGVDLVLTGHSHIYERSMLIDKAYDTPTTAKGVVLDDRDGDPDVDGPYKKSAGINPHEGDINIVTGNGGTRLKCMGVMPVMRKIIKEHGSVLVNVKGSTLTGRMISKAGKVEDKFQIVKEGKVTNKIVENPRRPVPPKNGNFTSPEGLEKVPASAIPVIPEHSKWKYRTGKAEDTQDSGWTKPEFDDKAWLEGPAGFGYADNDDATVLSDMKNNYKRVCIRREFVLESLDDVEKMSLAISWDDAFIAWINGEEVVRYGVEEGYGRNAKGIAQNQEAGAARAFPLALSKAVFKIGKNVIAIEGHNDAVDGSDFSLNPWLVKSGKIHLPLAK